MTKEAFEQIKEGLEEARNWVPPLTMKCWIVVDKDKNIKSNNVRWRKKDAERLLRFKKSTDKENRRGWHVQSCQLAIGAKEAE